jgi:capsular polysaccharide export protein
VITHGQPFYAGWGLTRDLAAPIARRNRLLTLEQLVAATLILYPRYVDPVTRLPCPPEVLTQRLSVGMMPKSGFLQTLRSMQGQFNLVRRQRAKAL